MVARAHRCRWLGARGQFANPPTAPCVGEVDPLRPVQLDERGFTSPFGEVRKALNDNDLLLTPPTLSGIWTNGEVSAGASVFQFAKLGGVENRVPRAPRSAAWSRMSATVARCVGGDTNRYDLHRWRRPLYRG